MIIKSQVPPYPGEAPSNLNKPSNFDTPPPRVPPEGVPRRESVNTFISDYVAENYFSGIQSAPFVTHQLQISPSTPIYSHNILESTSRYPENFVADHFGYDGQDIKPSISSANVTPVYSSFNPPLDADSMGISQSASTTLLQKPLFLDPFPAPLVSMLTQAANSTQEGHSQSASFASYQNSPWPPSQSPSISQPPKLSLSADHAPSERIGSEHNTRASSLSTPLTDQIQREAEKAFIRLIPAINAVDSNNLDDLLVLVAKQHGRDIPLDDFYNILFNPNKSNHASKISSCDSTRLPKEIGLKLCHLFLDIFKKSAASLGPDAPFGASLVNNDLLASVNFHELSRSLLAIKIMMDIVRTAEPNACSMTIPRISIYKVYYILCQRLICKYKNGCSSSIASETLILGQSRMGKLTKRVFPDLITKRLGKRGESKYHFFGLVWNTALVSNEILSLSALDLSHLKQHSMLSKIKPDLKTPSTALVHDNITVSFNDPSPRKHWPSAMRPSHSYVDKFIFCPNTNCSPRVWTVTPDSIPAQSQWAQDSIGKSMSFLKDHSPEIERKLRDLNAGIFFDDTQLWQMVQESLSILRMHMPCKALLHFFLIVLLSVFPMVLASDQEINILSKFKLRSALKRCVDGLKQEIAKYCPQDAINVRNFSSFLVKMVRLSEITSSVVNSKSLPAVVRAFIADAESLVDPTKENYDEELTFETSFANAIILSMRAYNFDIASIGQNGGEDSGIEVIYHVAGILEVGVRKIINILKQNVAAIENGEISHMPNDVPYQVFRLSSEVIHEDCLGDPMVSKLPICILTFLVQHITTVLQKVSIDEFRNRERHLSRETFKTWWVFSTTLQEYIKISGEIVALSQRLNKDTAGQMK